MLMPGSLGIKNRSRRVISKHFVSSVSTTTTFESRLAVLYNTLQRIEFSFYATPRGDILAEMPLYDFDPEDFKFDNITDAGIRALALSNNQLDDFPQARAAELGASLADRIQEIAARDRDPNYDKHFRFGIDDTAAHQWTFSDDRVRTQMRADSALIDGFLPAGTTSLFQAPQVVTLRSLIPQFGVRVEQVEPQVFISNPEAANALAHLHLNKLNAEALTSSVEVLPRLRVGPNRPLEIVDGPYVGTCRTMAHNLDWDGQRFDAEVTMNYLRVWTGLRTPAPGGGTRNLYKPIGGQASRPFDYARFFKRRSDRADQNRESATKSVTKPTGRKS